MLFSNLVILGSVFENPKFSMEIYFVRNSDNFFNWSMEIAKKGNLGTINRFALLFEACFNVTILMSALTFSLLYVSTSFRMILTY